MNTLDPKPKHAGGRPKKLICGRRIWIPSELLSIVVPFVNNLREELRFTKQKKAA